MPDRSANRAQMRQDGHKIACYMSVYKGTRQLQASLSSVPSYPATTLTISVITGSASNVKPGMRVDIYTAGGGFKGSTRVRYSGTINSTHLPVREHSKGIIPFTAGDIIEVYNEIPLSDLLVEADKDFNPDGMAYVDQGDTPGPWANTGGIWAGFATQLPIPYYGSRSIAVRDSGSGVGCTWTIPAGLSYAGGTGSTDDDIQVTGDAGEYLIKMVAEDLDTSSTSTAYVQAIIHDDDHPPFDVLITSPSGNEELGWALTAQPDRNGLLPPTMENIPDNCVAVLWSKEEVGDSNLALRGKVGGRGHILMVGIIRSEQGEKEKGQPENLTFQIISPMARLNEIIGYSKVMTHDASPDVWSEIDGLTTRRAILQLLLFYTNMMQAGYDVTFDDNYLDKPYQKYYLQKSDPASQVRELADGTDARFVASRGGQFEVHTRPDLLPIGDRPGTVKTLTIQADDVKRFSYTRQQWRPVETLECRGFTAGFSGNTPLFSRWPGNSPGVGKEADVVERLIADSQDDLNVRCGRRGAATDGIYVDANGVLQFAFDLELVMRGSYDIFDLYSEFVAVDFVTLRHDLSTQLFVLQSVDLSYDQGTAETTIHLKTATNGATGATYIPPSDTDVPPFTPPIQVFPIENPPVTTTPGVLPDGVPPLKIWGITHNGNEIFYSSSYDYTTGATVYALADASGNVTGTFLDALSDPWNYARRFVLTTDGLFKVDDLWASPDSWTLVADNTDITGFSGVWGDRMIMSINRIKYIVIGYSYSSVAVSFDYGSTFTRRNVTGAAPATTLGNVSLSGQNCALALSANNNPGAANKGYLWAGVAGYDGLGVHNIYLSKDWGLTWTRVATIRYPLHTGSIPRTFMLIPYKREGGAENTDDTSQYVIIWSGDGIYRVTAGGAVVAVNATGRPVNGGGPYALTSFTFDGNYLASFGPGSGSIPGTPVMYTTENGAASWTLRQTAGSTNVQLTGINGWSNNHDYLIWWGKEHIYYSLDRGVTKFDAIGNLATLIGSTVLPIVVEWNLADYI